MSSARSARPAGPIPGLFSRQSINLVIGTSGSAKTPFLLNQLEKYLQGDGFLGHPASPGAPWQMGLIYCAGTENAIVDALEDYPLLDNQITFPFEMWAPAAAELEGDALERIYLKLNGLLPSGKGPIKLLIIDDFQSMMISGDTGKIKAVKAFCQAMHAFQKKYDVTIIATTGSGKAKTHECYPQMADRIPGANCWGAEMDTLIVLELMDLHKQPEKRPETRRVVVKTRKAPIAVYWAQFQDGRLEIVPAYIPVEELTDTEEALAKKLAGVKPEHRLTKQDFLNWASEVGVSDATIERWMAKQVVEGVLKREGKGKNTWYVKAQAQ